MIPQEERRITIPETVYLALEDCASDERKKVKNALMKELITSKSLAQHILKNELVKRGYMSQNGKVKE